MKAGFLFVVSVKHFAPAKWIIGVSRPTSDCIDKEDCIVAGVASREGVALRIPSSEGPGVG